MTKTKLIENAIISLQVELDCIEVQDTINEKLVSYRMIALKRYYLKHLALNR